MRLLCRLGLQSSQEISGVWIHPGMAVPSACRQLARLLLPPCAFVSDCRISAIRRFKMWRDLRHAAASLRRSPVFTISAVAALGLAIGANATIFGLIDGL